MWLKILAESIRQAYQSLVSNKLRSFLSLLGIVIGIFCIISIKTAIDSLEVNLVEGFSELGSDVVYLEKMPWGEDPHQNYWKYAKRPEPSFKDYESVMDRSKLMQQAAYVIFTGGKTIKYNSNSVSNAFIVGSTYEYQSLQNLEVEQGRYFSDKEYQTGGNKVVLGASIAEELFQTLNAVGKEVKLFGQKFTVIGVLKKEGDSMFNLINFDEAIWIGYNNIKKYINVGVNNNSIGRMFAVKAKSGVNIQDLKSELTGIIRSSRRLKPTEENNFALNELGMFLDLLGSVFSSMNFAGFFIGLFAMLVGMFSVANIMFVSVKERTSLIGVKKALGAKNHVILTEFLLEAIFLCLLGGLIGLLIVYVMMKIATAATPMTFGLSLTNVIIGVGTSVIIGVISGILPALQAARMSPVEAIRS